MQSCSDWNSSLSCAEFALLHVKIVKRDEFYNLFISLAKVRGFSDFNLNSKQNQIAQTKISRMKQKPQTKFSEVNECGSGEEVVTTLWNALSGERNLYRILLNEIRKKVYKSCYNKFRVHAEAMKSGHIKWWSWFIIHPRKWKYVWQKVMLWMNFDSFKALWEFRRRCMSGWLIILFFFCISLSSRTSEFI